MEMSREENIVGNFHQPTSDAHPDDSIGNQQIWDEGGRQAGAIEYIPNWKPQSLDLAITNTNGDVVAEL
jgi:hypothetical protein